jgi:hypothetical protein
MYKGLGFNVTPYIGCMCYQPMGDRLEVAMTFKNQRL